MSKLLLRKLGKNGPLVSTIGLGCMGMSGAYGDKDDVESLKTLNRALDLGCNFWDTADAYGDNEKFLSQILKERRSEIFICTKFSRKFGIENKTMEIRGDREYVLEACQASLDHLGVDYIDLYYYHRVDRKVPIEETVGAMAELVKQGKVKYLGLSECSADTLRRAYKVHPIAAVQVEYSPWETTIERSGLLDACRKLGVAIVAYSPLGKGFLTGRFDPKEAADTDARKSWFPRMSSENVDHNLQITQKLQELAAQKGVKASQICLSWIFAQGEDFISIPGTRRVKYLEENLDSVNYLLSPDEEKQVREIVKQVGVKGERYSSVHMKDLDG